MATATALALRQLVLVETFLVGPKAELVTRRPWPIRDTARQADDCRKLCRYEKHAEAKDARSLPYSSHYAP